MLIDTEVGNLFVQTVGEGPTVVLWHSLLCDGTMWREQLGGLSDRFRFVNIDGPGHGRSERVTRPYTMDDCVAAARAVLDHLALDRVAWCGLSWGGMVGMRLAARDPERIAALVLMDCSARPERMAKKIAYRPMSAVTSAVGPTRLFAPILRRIVFAERTRRVRKDLVEGFIDTMMAMDKDALGRAVEAVIYDRVDCTHELSRVTAPTLVIVGDEDRATPPSESQHLANHITGARLIRVKDAGHLSALEQPEVINAELASFLDAHVA